MTFTQDTPILYYDPKLKGEKKWRDRRFFLYPAWMYRVVAPRTSYNKLNILEKAVLGLANAGVQSAEQIGTYLQIHKDLAALILSELSDRILINNYGIPTKQGMRLLEDEIFTTEEPVAGYIFQDVWTNELMPRFIDTEERADTRLNSSGFPELNLGDVGQPNYQSLVMPRVRDLSPQTPNSQDILKAVRSHSKALGKLASNISDLDDDDMPEESLHNSQILSLKRISFIEEEPTAIWLATFLYLPNDDPDWLVCDPFGLGDSPWLHKAINKQFEKDNFRELQKRILSMNESRDDQGTLSELMEMYLSDAKQQVEVKLTVAIRRYDAIYDSLVVMEQYRSQIRDLDSANQYNPLINSCLIECQKVCEQIFDYIRPKYSPNKEWKQLSNNDKAFNRKFINALAEKLKFTVPIPPKLTGPQQREVRNAAEYGNQSLRPHILASLLATRIFVDHPLHSLAKKYPDILSRLDDLAELRNNSGHGSSRASPNLTEVDRCIETVYHLVSSILNLSYSPD
ncbi:MAG: hypothetical protein IM596_13615 [Pseudanabaena sp. M051S1SP2A07QC]|jgi:hypothetical protein|nr:hypothetical protein [Pseudanabaena sp. M051S1SP2A07QC]MCA6595423.1 hypothetical protein [Pseudanabaena sp. M046S1SP1A06QC]